MAVTPNYSNCVVALFKHVGWIDIFGNFLDLKNLSSVNFVDAPSTLAFGSQFVRIDAFLVLTVVCEYDAACGGIVIYFFSIRFQCLDFLVNFLSYFIVQLNNRHGRGKSKYEWSSCIRHC